MNDDKRILICGAGGLGGPAAYELLRSWGSESALHIRLCDPDRIERSNLNRQVFFSDSDVGLEKAGSLSSRLIRLDDETKIVFETHPLAFTAETSEMLLSDVDYVIDATDSVQAKFLINDLCLERGIPFSYAGVIGATGQVLEVTPTSIHHSACLRCLFSGLSEEELSAENTTCRVAGIIGPVAGYVGALQARLALNTLLSGSRSESSSLYRFAPTEAGLKISKLSPNPACPHYNAAVTQLDLKDKRCPETFLYTKLALEQISAGKKLMVRFGNPDSRNNVQRTLLEEGHEAIATTCPTNDGYELLITK